MADERPKAKIKVRSKDPELDEEEDPEPIPPSKRPMDEDDQDEKVISGLTEEDILLKETLEKAVSKLMDKKSSSSTKEAAVDTLSKEIRNATASMTSVPKPLKFLRPHYDPMKSTYSDLKEGGLKKKLADVLSVMAMTMAEVGSRECLGFKLQGNQTELGSWGHEFIRALSGEISQEFVARTSASPPVNTKELLEMVDIIVPFQIQHNSEIEAVDLLLEVNELEKLLKYVDKSNFERVCLYLLRFGEYCIALEDLEAAMGVAYKLYLAQGQLPDAVRVALRMNDMGLVTKAMDAAKNMKDHGFTRKQLGLILGSHKFFGYESDDDTVNKLISNEDLWEYFQSLARELNVEEPKLPEEVYKSHLSESSSTRDEREPVESARQNLASTFVNAFVNVGFQKDKLLMDPSSNWMFKNRDHAMTSAAASLGMILLWNVNKGMTEIDKNMYTHPQIKAGSLLALGIVNCGVRDEVDPALGVLPDHLDRTAEADLRACAALGLGLAYAGSPRDQVADELVTVVSETDADAKIEVVSLAALGLGLCFAGTANDDVVTTLVQRLMEASEVELNQPIAKMLCLGLALLFLGQQENAEATIEAVKTVEHQLSKFAVVLIEICAYTGTGNVLQVQKLMHLCAEHLNKDGEVDTSPESVTANVDTSDPSAAAAAAAQESKVDEGKEEEKSPEQIEAEKEEQAKNSVHQSAAVIGVALITMGEKIGREMAQRTFQHLLQYGDVAVRRGVPLAMALSRVSDPDYATIDILSKLTHDADNGTAMSAIMALGLIGAGTNNSRIAQLLRQLATYHVQNPNPLFVVRLAQGLLHAGKGLITMAPYHSDRTLLMYPAVAGILTVLLATLDVKGLLSNKHHFLMFTLVTAIRPRMLMTLDADTMEPINVKVRVGQAVETVGQAGRPKTITGFQTHQTPVLIGHDERAELATDEYKPLTNVLEGLVLLKQKKKKTQE